jgi:hypothetical protein
VAVEDLVAESQSGAPLTWRTRRPPNLSVAMCGAAPIERSGRLVVRRLVDGDESTAGFRPRAV